MTASFGTTSSRPILTVAERTTNVTRFVVSSWGRWSRSDWFGPDVHRGSWLGSSSRSQGPTPRRAPRPGGAVERENREVERVIWTRHSPASPVKHGAGHKSYDGRMREIAAREAKNQFGQLLDAAQRAPVRVTKKGRPVGVMMSMEQYARLRGAAWDALNETMDRMAKRATARGLTDAKLEKLLADDS